MYPRAALKFALLAQLASLASATYSDPKVLDAYLGEDFRLEQPAGAAR